MGHARGPLHLDAPGGLRDRGGPRLRGDDDPRPLPITARPQVVLYSAPGCHLCEAARRVLDEVRADVPFELDEVDITGVPDLERRYRERIPVVAIGGVEAFTYFVHPDALRRRLAV